MSLKTLPIFLAFLLMGVADAMGPMSDAVKTDYKISNVLASLLPFFVFIAFAVFSVPGGLLAARIGKKKLLLLGLGINAVAMAVPSLAPPGFVTLLGCIFLLGVGTTFLQVAGNPIMRDVSPAGGYSRNLSLAQGIKGSRQHRLNLSGDGHHLDLDLRRDGLARSLSAIFRSDGSCLPGGRRAEN